MEEMPSNDTGQYCFVCVASDHLIDGGHDSSPMYMCILYSGYFSLGANFRGFFFSDGKNP